MNILIDTNILIHLEDNKVVDQVFSEFYNIAIVNNCNILYHPQGIPNDILRDKDLSRRDIILSKLNKYQQIENTAIPTELFLSEINNKKVNDKIDNLQLYQLYKGYVDLFITQDKGIHSKAKRLTLGEKVVNIDEALKLLKKEYTIVIPTHPILKSHSMRELDKELSSSFFDSLKLDYDTIAFERWFAKCIIEDRQCYTLRVDDQIVALLIYNLESTNEHQIPSIYQDVLKICTLKVSNDAFGLKLGELFINKMFEYCINQKINYLYLTVYDKQVHLILLLETFGFRKECFINRQGLEEIRMVKCLDINLIDKMENHISIHPFYYDNDQVNKYAIPIRPNFYGTLFKDGNLRQPSLFDLEEDSINEIQGNTIIKAYISNSRVKSLKRGDILLFYSSQTNKVIEPLGILETAERVSDFGSLWNIVRKKTVFSPERLEKWLEEKGELHVITFRLITYLKKKVQLEEIQKIASFKNKIQTITRLKESDYQKLKKDGYFDKRYIIN